MGASICLKSEEKESVLGNSERIHRKYRYVYESAKFVVGFLYLIKISYTHLNLKHFGEIV